MLTRRLLTRQVSLASVNRMLKGFKTSLARAGKGAEEDSLDLRSELASSALASTSKIC